MNGSAFPPGISAVLERCEVCGSSSERLFTLRNLPLTDTFLRPGQQAPSPLRSFDCSFCLCEVCGHGQLSEVVSPALLYGSSYGFRTSSSANAQKGTRFFLSFLDELRPGRTFRSVLDLGCNDLYLLRQLNAPTRIGIDPIWRGLEDTCPDPSLQVHGKTLEELDLKAICAEPPDLIVCRHTLEHMQSPRSVLVRLLEAAAPDALLVFEVPGLDILLARLRFDQVFHQHLQYFSRASFSRLLGEVGCRPLAYRENPRDWGALAVAFQRGGGQDFLPPASSLADASRRFQAFTALMGQAAERVLELPEPLLGFGASQMLPTLDYHLGGTLGRLSTVYDDDPSKDGLRYGNLPLRVTAQLPPQRFQNHAVVLTALEHSAVLIRRLVELGGAREILSPLQLL